MYDLICIDVPWDYYGSATKNAAASKHYELMPDEDVLRLDVRSYMAARSIAFVWATCPRLDFAIEAIKAWGLHYRGVAFVWVKTRADGRVIGAQGVRASITKPTIEFVLAASTQARGRPLKIADESVAQVDVCDDVASDDVTGEPVFAPRGEHSAKPAEIYRRIETMYPTATKCELFARAERPGWTCVGDQLTPPSRVRMVA